MTFDELVDRVRSQFAATQAQAESFVNERHRTMVAESLWRAVEKTVATTVAGQSLYALPTDLVDLRILYIEDRPYEVVGREEFRALRNPEEPAHITGSGGVASETFDEDGVHYIEVYPTPELAGLDVVALEALQPEAMTYGAAMSPIVPLDFHEELLEGAIATAYRHIDERPDLARDHEEAFREGVRRLTSRRHSRVGSGARQMRVRVGGG